MNRWFVWGLLLMALSGWRPAPATAEFYGDVTTKRYHATECPEAPLIKKKNLKIFDSEAEARAKAFYPCPLCSALVRKEAAPAIAQRKLSKAVSRSDGYVVDKSTRSYHQVWCPLLKNVDARQLLKVADIEKAAAGGNSPCAVCNPPVAFVRAVTVAGNRENSKPAAPSKATGGVGSQGKQ